jgi:hypothetical protein
MNIKKSGEWECGRFYVIEVLLAFAVSGSWPGINIILTCVTVSKLLIMFQAKKVHI